MYKYVIEDGFTREEFFDEREAADWIMENCDDEYYDKMLDTCFEEIDICGIKYSPSVALYRVDETAYYCGKNDWADSEASDLSDELRRMGYGEHDEFYGCKISCIKIIEDNEEDDAADE